MNQLTTQEMSRYLKQAMDLEVSVYAQERALSESRKHLDESEPRYEAPAEYRPEKRTVKEPPKPSLIDVEKEEQVKASFRSGFIKIIIIGLIGIIGGIVCISVGLTVIGVLAIVLCAALIAWYGIAQYGKKANPGVLNEHKAENEKRLAAYQEERNRYESEKELEEKRYQGELESARRLNNERKEIAEREYQAKRQRHSIATEAVNQLRTPLDETKATLEKLYALDVVFPKYRNLVAISTMYEYFASGRVSELGGPNGAYNLYESELRQNLIINKLDVIVTNLENIKENQYALYTELQKTNATLRGISSDVSMLLSETKSIAANTRTIADSTKEIEKAANITAYCSQITAENTEALKYISLING